RGNDEVAVPNGVAEALHGYFITGSRCRRASTLFPQAYAKASAQRVDGNAATAYLCDVAGAHRPRGYDRVGASLELRHAERRHLFFAAHDVNPPQGIVGTDSSQAQARIIVGFLAPPADG